jgi:hypothetical protein
MGASEGHLSTTGLQDPHQGTLTAADVNWLTGLQHNLGSVKTVAVRDLGRSADQRAEQLRVLSNVIMEGTGAAGRDAG